MRCFHSGLMLCFSFFLGDIIYNVGNCGGITLRRQCPRYKNLFHGLHVKNHYLASRTKPFPLIFHLLLWQYHFFMTKDNFKRRSKTRRESTPLEEHQWLKSVDEQGLWLANQRLKQLLFLFVSVINCLTSRKQ